MVKKTFKITNVKSNHNATHTISTTKTGKDRNQLTILDVDGMEWQEKKELVEKELKNIYEEIPDGISFIKRKTWPDENNPDGLRIFVHCCWIKRNRFHDNYGKFELGRLVKAINKQIDGETRKRILLKKKV